MHSPREHSPSLEESTSAKDYLPIEDTSKPREKDLEDAASISSKQLAHKQNFEFEESSPRREGSADLVSHHGHESGDQHPERGCGSKSPSGGRGRVKQKFVIFKLFEFLLLL